MSQGSVYIETTIPSYYFETRTSAEIVTWRQQTRVWWRRYSHSYDLFTSQFVMAELAEAPVPKGRQGKRLLKGIGLLEKPKGIEEVIEYYINEKLMPSGAGGDAAHLALASMHGMDYVLTWNCRHLANANKVRHLAVLNERIGLHVPVITTPLTLVPEDYS